MPSPEIERMDAHLTMTDEQTQLEVFYQNIADCIAVADWEALDSVLLDRQNWLEQVFNGDIAQQAPEVAKQLGQSILARDALLMAQVQQQKQLIMDQQSALELGKRAVKAYSS